MQKKHIVKAWILSFITIALAVTFLFFPVIQVTVDEDSAHFSIFNYAQQNGKVKVGNQIVDIARKAEYDFSKDIHILMIMSLLTLFLVYGIKVLIMRPAKELQKERILQQYMIAGVIPQFVAIIITLFPISEVGLQWIFLCIGDETYSISWFLFFIASMLLFLIVGIHAICIDGMIPDEIKEPKGRIQR